MDKEVMYAWAAGFFDGEGSTCCSKYREDAPNGLGGIRRRYPSLRISVAQRASNREPLDKLCQIFGVGKVHGPAISRLNGKEWLKLEWHVSSTQAVEVLRLMWPYLSSDKKEQAKQAIEAFNASLDLPRLRKSGPKQAEKVSIP